MNLSHNMYESKKKNMGQTQHNSIFTMAFSPWQFNFCSEYFMRRLPFNAHNFHAIHRYTGVVEIEMHNCYYKCREESKDLCTRCVLEIICWYRFIVRVNRFNTRQLISNAHFLFDRLLFLSHARVRIKCYCKLN